MPTVETLLSTAELAKRRHVTTRTILRMVARGQLTPAIKLPGATGAYLFAADDAEHTSWSCKPAAPSTWP